MLSGAVAELCRYLIYRTTIANADGTTFLGILAYRVTLLLGRSCVFVVFMLVGVILYHAQQMWSEKLHKYRWEIIWGCLIAMAVLFTATKSLPHPELQFIRWDNSVLYYFVGSTGAACLMLGCWACQAECRALEAIGRHSLIINGIHLALDLVKLSYRSVRAFLTPQVHDALSQDIRALLTACTVCAMVLLFFCPILQRAFPWMVRWSEMKEKVASITSHESKPSKECRTASNKEKL